MWLQVQFKFNYCIVGAENGAQRALSLLERWAGLLEFSGAWAERWAGVPLSGNGAESGGHKNRQERWAEIVLLVTLRSYAPLTRSCCDDPWKSLKLSLMTPYDKPCTTSYHCFTISLTTSYLNCTVTKISPHTDENCCNTVILLDALERNFDAIIVPDISIYGFGVHITISSCSSLSQSFGDTFFQLAVVENLDEGAAISEFQWDI